MATAKMKALKDKKEWNQCCSWNVGRTEKQLNEFLKQRQENLTVY